MEITFYNTDNRPTAEELNRITDFLYTHLGIYGDPIADIRKAAAYALGEGGTPGGFVVAVCEQGMLVAAAIVNRTGMRDYIPENLLVYIAVHSEQRGHGTGRHLLSEIIRRTQGGIALHVEPGNPAIRLYENLGFENKYLEMRLQRKEES